MGSVKKHAEERSHPALPPMAESLGTLSSAKFGGETIENEKR